MYLFPTDGSEQSRGAEETIKNLLDPENTEIFVLTVIDDDPNPMASADIKADYETELLSEAQNTVNEAAERLADKGYEVKTSVEHGHPGEVICEVAEDESVNGIIMGRRGRSSVTEILLGSVSRYVLQQTDRPVTVVPPYN